MKNKLFILIALCISIHVLAQEPKKEIPLKYGATNIGKRQDEAMKRFRDNRLGEFITGDCMPFPVANGKVKYIMELPNGSSRGLKFLLLNGWG
jgi:hypothetical protein